MFAAGDPKNKKARPSIIWPQNLAEQSGLLMPSPHLFLRGGDTIEFHRGVCGEDLSENELCCSAYAIRGLYPY